MYGTLLRTLTAAFVVGAFVPATAVAGNLVIRGLQDTEGQVLIAIFTCEESWLGEEPWFGRNLPIELDARGEMRLPLPDDMPERVAVAVIHDRNANNTLDTHRLGWPVEPYGFSNGVRPRLGPPSFNSARLSVNGTGDGSDIVVKVR